MILLTILILMLVLLVAVSVLAISIGGTLAVVLFGDVFVCILIIAWIIKRIITKKGRRR